MILHDLLNLEPGYCIRIDKENVCGHEYLCDTDDLIYFGKQIEKLVYHINRGASAQANKTYCDLGKFLEELNI
jgi:hypothetical protein